MKKNILITGASGNLGKATVLGFLNDGHRVIAIVSPGKTLGFEVQGDIVVVEANLTDESSVATIVTKIIAENKFIDVALLLVGGYAPGSVFETDAVLNTVFAASTGLLSFISLRP